MAKWTRDQTTVLLELYQQYPHLYDNSNIYYPDRNKRQNTLLFIAKELEKIRPRTTSRDVKQKLRTIRTQYCVEKYRYQKSESKDCYTPKLWCYDLLKFLDGFTPNEMSIRRKPYRDLASPIPNDDKNHSVFRDSTTYRTTTASSDNQNQDDSFVAATLSDIVEAPEHLSCGLNRINPPHNSEKKSRNYIFAKFICEELDSIQDGDILDDTKWKIQILIREALQEDRNHYKCNRSFQGIQRRIDLSPSLSQSSPSVCLQNSSTKQEMSDEDV